MGNTNQKVVKKKTVVTDFHHRCSQIFSENSEKSSISAQELSRVFPSRTIFCQNFQKWMKVLNYTKTANKEGFIFACEILLLESDQIISTTYRNHSFVFIDLFMHMCLQKLPNEISTVTYSDLLNFAETLSNFFFKDDNKLKDLPQKMTEMITSQLNIKSDPVSYSSISK